MHFTFRSIGEYGPEPASRRTGKIHGMDQLDSIHSHVSVVLTDIQDIGLDLL